MSFNVKKKTVGTVAGIEGISLTDKVHMQLIKVVQNEELYKQFDAFLASKYCTENLLFWQAIEDLRAESRESKRREKALVYMKRFIASDGSETVFLPYTLQNELTSMITDKKIFLEMKPFNEAQKQIEMTLQPLVIQFLTLSSKNRGTLIREAISKRSLQFESYKMADLPTFTPRLFSSNTHQRLSLLDEDKSIRDNFIDLLAELGAKNNFYFWSEAHHMLLMTKPNKKFKLAQNLYKKYLKEGAELALRLKSNFKHDLAYLFQHNRIKDAGDIPYQLFTNLLIEIELALQSTVDIFFTEHCQAHLPANNFSLPKSDRIANDQETKPYEEENDTKSI